MNGLLIAGTASGVGKTTVTLAIIAAMRRRGRVVQPFKAGPDFLDTGHHTRIAGRTARNLDTWMLSAEANKNVLREASQGADSILVEGMMGLFDGKDGTTEAGSSAEIAKLLKLPVVLVLDAAMNARSIAAVVLGFESFDPQLPLAGIILNRVAGERHYQMLRDAILSACKTPIVGWLPREPAIEIPERHLGLHTAEEADARGSSEGLNETIETLAALAEEHLDLDYLLALECGLKFDREFDVNLAPRANASAPPVRIGVARDAAFSFYYEDNLDLLRQNGAVIVPFSPTQDTSLPPGLSALYLGGGYPELFAQQLSANTGMLTSIKDLAASGRLVYAECGGMIYLSQQLTTTNGLVYPMANVLPLDTEVTERLVRFGYVEVELTQDCLLGPCGTILRGHSFHYSRIAHEPDLATSYRVQYSLSGEQQDEGYRIGNVLASYIHLHFGAAPSAARHLVEAARRAQTKHRVPA